MFPGLPQSDKSLIPFPGFPVPSKAVQAFPDFRSVVIAKAAAEVYPDAKSIIIDIANNWEDAQYVGLRSVDLYKNDALLEIVQADYTAYATSQINASFASEFVYDTTLTKIGVGSGAAWLSASFVGDANQRLIVVFDEIPDFDSMVINNYHQGGNETDRGSKDVIITISSDSITDITYGASIANSKVIYTGALPEHTYNNVQDDINLDDLIP